MPPLVRHHLNVSKVLHGVDADRHDDESDGDDEILSLWDPQHLLSFEFRSPTTFTSW